MSTDLTVTPKPGPKPAMTGKGLALRIVTLGLAAFMAVTAVNGYRDQAPTDDTAGYQAPAQPTEVETRPGTRPEIAVPVEDYRDTAEQMAATGKSSLREIAETNGVDTAKMERQAKRLAAKVRGNAPALLDEARKATQHGKSAEQMAEQAQTLLEGILR
jgi:uncharacterized protein YfaQ (DUF2300 family)